MNNNRERAIALINAYFDNEDIVVKDPKAGIEDWTSINSNRIWTYLDMFCRNLDKYKIIEPKQDKFDPKTLSLFSKILVKSRKSSSCKWVCIFYSLNRYRQREYPNNYEYCIPYNEDTKHLLGTSDEAPKFYRYWEE